MKKRICLALILCLIVSMAIPVYAGDGYGKELEQAILTVKTIVEIPEEYKEFSYYTYENETEWGAGTVWNLNWTGEEAKATIHASVDWKGNLLYFEHYQVTDDSGLAKVTREQAAVISKEFLQKAVPDLAPNMKEVNLQSNLQNNYRHVFQYRYHVNDIPVSFINVSVHVNKYTGSVELYGGLDAGFDLPDFPAAEGIITLDEAKGAFLEDIGIELIYKSYYDYKSKLLHVFPAYRIANSTKAIDAHTGEVVDLYYGYSRLVAVTGDAMDAGGMGSSESENLSREELEAIEKLGKLLTKEDAISKLAEQIPLRMRNTDMGRASLRKDTIDQEKYIWEIYFDNMYGSVDAQTGELLSYGYYGDDAGGKLNLTKDAARKIAENFLQKVVPQKFSESKYIPDYNEDIIIFREEEKPEAYTFRYNRVVDGVVFIDNGLNVAVNRTTGNITSYSCNWFDSATFPSVKGVLTDSEMMEEMMKEYAFDVAYEKTGKDRQSDLVYVFDQAVRAALFEPFTGNRIMSNGKPYESEVRPEYQDIKDHWSEKIVLELMENGYYLKSELFNSDNTITQIDFFRYLFTPEIRYYDDADLYEMLEMRGIIEEGEKAPESLLKRQDAAKFLIRYLGLGLAGERSEIYTNKYRDKIDDNYKGYAMLCYGLG
ncbi:MAG TPA: hypothetical protein DCK81_03115, partial [Clostridiales bacterium UBA9856]|nr:hypothetical protein [Clostridiales bacterium UBA9856]